MYQVLLYSCLFVSLISFFLALTACARVGKILSSTQGLDWSSVANLTGDIATVKKTVDDPNDKYQQIRFDRRNLYYYIDDDGFFVIRFNGPDYDYSTIGPK